ncbi:hypothetical protein ACXHQ0_04840 [Vibrio antiquarius]
MSLEEIKARLQEVSDTKESLLTQVCKIYQEEYNSNEKFLGEALSTLHNSGEIDLVYAVRGANKNSLEYDCLTILYAFASTLTLLDAQVEDVICSLVQLMQHENADSSIYRSFEQFCSKKKQRPRDSIRFILEQSELCKYATFLSSSILSYGSESLSGALHATEALLAHRNSTVRSQAYLALSDLAEKESEASIIWEHFGRHAGSEINSGCRASIIKAILNFGQKFPSYWPKIEDLLLGFSEKDDPELVHAISDSIAFIDLPKSTLHLLVKYLENVSPKRKDTLLGIDYFLVKMVKRGTPLVAVELLESILDSGVTLVSLTCFSRELLEQHKELLNHLVTKWFLSEKTSLCSNILELLSNEGTRDIELKADINLLKSDDEQVLSTQKAIGWLFTHPIAVTSFIISVHDIASKLTCKELEKVLYNPLLLSYPGKLKQFLQLRIDKGVQVGLCERLLSKLQDYDTDIEKTSGLKELMAPSENVNLYWKELNKGMEEAHEEASKSSLMSLFTTQRLLYGNSSICYLHRGDGEQVRQEIAMQSYTHSTEMPRLNVLDPETLDYLLRVYRHEGMKNEVDS